MYNDIFKVLERSGARIRFVDEDVEYKTDIGGTTLRITGLTPGKRVLAKLSRDMEMIYDTTDPCLLYTSSASALWVSAIPTSHIFSLGSLE